MWLNWTPVKHWTTSPCTSSESRTLQDTSTHTWRCSSMFWPVEFSHIAIQHLVLVPSIESWSRLVVGREEIVTPDHEIEREATLNRYIREPKPFSKMISRLTMGNGRLFLNIIERGVQRLNDRGLCGWTQLLWNIEPQAHVPHQNQGHCKIPVHIYFLKK